MPTGASLLITASTSGDATQQSEIVSRGNRTCGSKSWYTAAAENVGPEATRVGMFGGHTRVSESVDKGEVEACWECAAPNTFGRTKARTWVENTWNWAKGGGHLLGKSDGGSGRRGRPPA